MKILMAYLKQHRKSLLFFAAAAVLELFMTYLYHVPGEMALFWFGICGFFGVIILGWDFYRYREKHLVLENMENTISVNLQNLPEPVTLLEEDYARLLEKLEDTLIQVRTDSGRQQRDMMDYYTLWVHQIKTPIAAMRLMLQNQDEYKDENRDRELNAQLFKIEQYADMVLQYLRLESPSTDYKFEQVNMDQVVRQAVRKYAPMFIRKKIALKYEPLNCTVLTDEKWISFVLEQILSKALKYTKEGSVSIYMSGEGSKILAIEDTGIGIAPEDLPLVGKKNYTGFNGRMDKKATGLGLYLCRTILKRLGHQMHIESKEGIGTKVSIDLSNIRVEYE